MVSHLLNQGRGLLRFTQRGVDLLSNLLQSLLVGGANVGDLSPGFVGRAVAWCKVGVGQAWQSLQRRQSLVQIKAKGYLVFLKRILWENRVTAEEYLPHRQPHLVGGVTRQLDHLHLERSDLQRSRIHDVVHPTGLGQRELLA